MTQQLVVQAIAAGFASHRRVILCSVKIRLYRVQKLNSFHHGGKFDEFLFLFQGKFANFSPFIHA